MQEKIPSYRKGLLWRAETGDESLDALIEENVAHALAVYFEDISTGLGKDAESFATVEFADGTCHGGFDPPLTKNVSLDEFAFASIEDTLENLLHPSDIEEYTGWLRQMAGILIQRADDIDMAYSATISGKDSQ